MLPSHMLPCPNPTECPDLSYGYWCWLHLDEQQHHWHLMQDTHEILMRSSCNGTSSSCNGQATIPQCPWVRWDLKANPHSNQVLGNFTVWPWGH